MADFCCLLRTLVIYTYVATKDARWVRRFPCSLGPRPRRPTTAVCPRRGAAAAFVHRDCGGCGRTTPVCTSYCCCVPGTPVSAQVEFYLIEDTCQFRFDNPMGRAVRFWAEI